MRRRVQSKKIVEQSSEKKEQQKPNSVSVEERIALLAKQNREKSMKQDHIAQEKKEVKVKEKVVVKREAEAKGEIEDVEEKDLALVESKVGDTSMTDSDEADTMNSQPVEIQVEESSSLFVRSIAPVIIGIVVGFLTGLTVIYYYQNNSNVLSSLGFLQKNDGEEKTDSNIEATPTLTEVVSTPTPTEFVNKKDLYDITVLNGSGKGGEAGRLQSTLEGKEYSILEIGNASSSNYKETVVQAKEEVEESFITTLRTDLSAIYTLKEENEDLARGDDADVVIIIGSEVAASSE